MSGLGVFGSEDLAKIISEVTLQPVRVTNQIIRSGSNASKKACRQTLLRFRTVRVRRSTDISCNEQHNNVTRLTASAHVHNKHAYGDTLGAIVLQMRSNFQSLYLTFDSPRAYWTRKILPTAGFRCVLSLNKDHPCCSELAWRLSSFLEY